MMIHMYVTMNKYFFPYCKITENSRICGHKTRSAAEEH